MQQDRRRLRYDRPAMGSETGIHAVLTEDLSGYTLHIRTVPSPVDRMRGEREEEYAVRVDPERARHWYDALEQERFDTGYVGATTDLQRVAIYDGAGERLKDVDGALPPAFEIVVDDILVAAGLEE